MSLKLFSLLYLNDQEKGSVNVFTKSFRDQVDVYIDNAITLSKSLSKKGIEFTLLTNQKDIIDSILDLKHEEIKVEEIICSTEIPSGVSFYFDHFKLDTYRYLANQIGYVGLCDLDVICINEIPQCLLNNIKQGVPICYDVSDQVIPAHGHNVIIRDLEAILETESEGRWSGGEFVSGTPEFFNTLANEIKQIYPSYIKHIDSLHHVSHETPVSAAIERLRKRGMYIADAGTLGIIGRFWSRKVLHPQKPFEYFQTCFLLHLPADKRFLAEVANKEFSDRDSFVKAYSKYLKSSTSKPKTFLKKVKKKLGI